MSSVDLEVGTPAGGGVTAASRRAVATWLLACCALVFAMVVLGGVTRLTGSGLSMVAWEPVVGVLPPLDDTAWQLEFDRYRESPEFRHVNAWMSVEDFKRIYWFEWAHRLLGRLVGVAFALPFAWFLATRRIPRGLGPHLAGCFLLGGAQGLLGWYMVKSGLVDDPHVSQYRLAAHLVLAVLIYAYMLWIALALLEPARQGGPPARRGLAAGAAALAVLVLVTITSGAFVAGLRAGHVFNTYPTMGGEWLPAGLYALEPALRNWFENPTTAQFNHRLLAHLVLAAAVALWLWGRRSRLPAHPRGWLRAVLVVAAAQFALGLATLLLRVPVPVAAAHQAGALLLLTALVGLAATAGSPAGRGRWSP